MRDQNQTSYTNAEEVSKTVGDMNVANRRKRMTVAKYESTLGILGIC